MDLENQAGWLEQELAKILDRLAKTIKVTHIQKDGEIKTSPKEEKSGVKRKGFWGGIRKIPID